MARRRTRGAGGQVDIPLHDRSLFAAAHKSGLLRSELGRFLMWTLHRGHHRQATEGEESKGGPHCGRRGRQQPGNEEHKRRGQTRGRECIPVIYTQPALQLGVGKECQSASTCLSSESSKLPHLAIVAHYPVGHFRELEDCRLELAVGGTTKLLCGVQ